MMMAFEQEQILLEPASPGAQYLSTPEFTTFSIICVMESEIQINDSLMMAFIKNVWVPSSPRFSSIMVTKKNGSKKWKRVKVNIKDHVVFPTFLSGKSPDYYNDQLNCYLSNISMEKFSQNIPPWEIHLFKYPTSNAAGTIILKVHHTLGDGYTLMGVLLSCVQRLDDPSLPLTLPPLQTNLKSNDSFMEKVPQFFERIMSTIPDFGWSILKSTLIEDDVTPIRSGHEGVELKPYDITTISFPLDSIKQIKANLKVTINDVITGIIMFGSRLYMQHEKQDSTSANCTTLVLLNTRMTGGAYKSTNEMFKSNAKVPSSGNQFAFLEAAIPELHAAELSNPISFILDAHKMIKKKRNSAGTYLSGILLEILRKLKGPEETARYVYGKLKNSSMMISNMIGPTDQMAFGGHPIKGMYFYVSGVPQSVVVLVLSYMGKLTLTIGTEKGFIDSNKFKLCIENAFETIFKKAVEKRFNLIISSL